MNSKALQKQLDQMWTTQDLCRFFYVTAMTIHLWRKHRGLPYIEIKGNERPAVRFVPDEVRRWAKAQGMSFKGKAA